MGVFSAVFGKRLDKHVRACKPSIRKVNAYSQDMAALSDSGLRAKTEEFRHRLHEKGEKLDALLPEAFAVVREASKRTLGLYHYDVQLIGGMILHKGMIAEMRTGEGKTLVATLPAYLNALTGKGSHVITVNDYLARRDAEWMGKVYEFLGLSVGCIIAGMDDVSRKAAYAADVTYGTNNEFGFDYLRDNMKFTAEDMVQRPLHYAIVDEIDSILVDEARTPLVISGHAEGSSDLYRAINNIIPHLTDEDIELEEKHKNVSLTDKGAEHVETLLRDAGLVQEGENMYDITHIAILHHVNQGLSAHKIFTKDKDYIVRDGQVILIDEFTGRMMEDRRFSDGLHQALEAKENVDIRHENQTLASITFQNYFRMYSKLSGMTGTAKTEEKEFGEIYGLRVVDVPSNRTPQRIDEDDAIYKSADEKYNAIIETIHECVARKQPVLVGTVSIEKSELLARLLDKAGIAYEILNAKQHEREAYIVAQAGRPGAVTIATNMAGRGTDIMLGGNAEMLFESGLMQSQVPSDQAAKRLEDITAQVEEDKKIVLEAGGLYVLVTERHESRRIDNQLRGRSGRQGDPGTSKFFLSLEDDLMRIFGSEKLKNSALMKGLEEGEVITHPWLSRVIAKAQQRVERQHFDIRKNLLRFDSVMNEQRTAIYDRRKEFIYAEDVSDALQEMAEDVISDVVDTYIPPRSYPEEWDIAGLEQKCHAIFGAQMNLQEFVEKDGVTESEIEHFIQDTWNERLAAKDAAYTEELMKKAKKKILLLTLDQMWKEHLLALDHLKQGIGLRAYGQKDPLGEYKKEALTMFHAMTDRIRETTILRIAHLEISEEDRRYVADYSQMSAEATQLRHGALEAPAAGSPSNNTRSNTAGMPGVGAEKISRNAKCPCGSGKKYKHCCGAAAHHQETGVA